MARLYRLAMAWCVAILGGFFAAAGAVLLSLGGSPYYLVAGLAMVASGGLIGRGSLSGLWLFVAVWVGTLIWALWEVGLDGLQLVPRLVAPTVLLILVLLTEWRARSWRSRAHAVPALAAALVAVGIGGLVLRGDGVEAQDAPAAPIVTAPTGEADADWRDYGGTLSGRRYSALTDITPQNVGRLKLAWKQRTGDLPVAAETQEHKREYHSEATPIHIGDTLYTCTPHSFVQAIDATTGKTKWSWHEDAPIQGNNYLVCRGVTYFEAPAGTPCPRRIFAPTFNARLVALDADTGRPCASFANGGAIDLRTNMGTSKPSDQIGTTPPVVVNNRLIIGERIIDNVNRDIPSGVVRAYDPVSGAPIWAWDVGRSQDAIAPLPPGQTYTRGTPNVWGAITADAASGIVYLGTGNASPDYWIGYPAVRRSFRLVDRRARRRDWQAALDAATGPSRHVGHGPADRTLAV